MFRICPTPDVKMLKDNFDCILEDLFTEGKFMDVTIVSDDQVPFLAHKVILSVHSPVLKDLIFNIQHEHPLIYLRGIESEELRAVLEFMYLGKVEVNQLRIIEFCRVAKELKMTQLCQNLLENDIVHDKLLFDNFKQPIDKSITNIAEEILDLNIPEIIKQEVNESNLHRVKCTECDASFTNKSHLARHKRSKHVGIRYKCSSCNYESTDKSYLKNHETSIHGEVKYSCNQCYYETTRKTYLKNHVKYVHEGVKYSCNQCDFKTGWGSNMSLHKKTKH